jgi:hypothetical protein
MSDTVLVAVIGGVVTVLGFFQTGILAYVALKQSKQSVDMKELAQNTNSIKDALVKATATASHAEGKAEGKAEGVAEGRAKV